MEWSASVFDAAATLEVYTEIKRVVTENVQGESPERLKELWDYLNEHARSAYLGVGVHMSSSLTNNLMRIARSQVWAQLLSNHAIGRMLKNYFVTEEI